MQTRILVTHGVSFLPYVDEIVVLVDGGVSEVGSYKSLRASKGAFSEFLNTYAHEQNNRTKSESGSYTSALWIQALQAKKAIFSPNKTDLPYPELHIQFKISVFDMLCCFCVGDTADVELIPERDDAQVDYPLEDTVALTLKRDHSIRRSQRSSRLEEAEDTMKQLLCVRITGVTCLLLLIYFVRLNFVASD